MGGLPSVLVEKKLRVVLVVLSGGVLIAEAAWKEKVS
jgi:hypothetical protein